MIKYLSILFLLSIIGCGTSSSLNQINSVRYASVIVNDSLSVTGRLVDIDSSKIEIVVNGALKGYDRNSIKGYSIEKHADERLVNEDILKNTSRTASNTAFFVIMSVVGIIATIAAIK